MNVEKILKTNKKLPLIGKSIIHVVLVANKINDRLTRSLKPHGVSIQQFNVLRILRGQRGKPANLTTLNERMVSKMSNTTRLVDKLLLKGLVQRGICQENRRKIEIYITKKGEQALSSMNIIVDSTQKELLINFSEKELLQLNGLLVNFDLK